MWLYQVGGAWVQGYTVLGGRGLATRLLYQVGGGGRGLGMRLLYRVGGCGCIRWEGHGCKGARLLYQVGGAGARGCIRWEGPGYEAAILGGRGVGARLLYQVGGAWI